MKEMKRDILSESLELRKQVYTVPEGYFDAFKAEMTPYKQRQTAIAGKLVPYLSLAATFLFLVTAGTFFLQRSTPSEEFTQEDFILYSSNMSGMDYYDDMYQIADADIADEDIIEYLIYSGISAEEIELSK